MPRSPFYKRDGAVDEALRAALRLADAITLCGVAEARLNDSGYRGAAIGVRQAALRLSSWEEKLLAAIVREDGTVRDPKLAAEILERKGVRTRVREVTK